MERYIIGIGAEELRTDHTPQQPLAVTAAQLEEVGISPRQTARTLEELQRTVDATPALNTEDTLLPLAKKMAHFFL